MHSLQGIDLHAPTDKPIGLQRPSKREAIKKKARY